MSPVQLAAGAVAVEPANGVVVAVEVTTGVVVGVELAARQPAFRTKLVKSSPGAESIAAPTTSKWHAELLSLNENAPQAALATQALAQSPREDGWSRSRRSSVDAKRSFGSDFPKLPMPPGQSF